MSNVLDLLRQQNAERAAQLDGVEIPESSNLDVVAGTLVKFTGSVPIFDPDGAAGADPTHIEGGVPCALDLRQATMRITEAHAFQQPRGGLDKAEADRAQGLEPEMMNQVEGSLAIMGAKIGFMDGEDFLPHPMYEDHLWDFITSRALEIYWKSPFRTPDDIVEDFRQTLLENEPHGFVPADLGNQPRESRRTERWHLQAPSSGSNIREKILARQRTGFLVHTITLAAPREPLPQANGVLRAEWKDFMYSIEMNLHRVTVALASGATRSDAGRLSSSLTGVDNIYPLRATVATFNWSHPVMGGTEERTLSLFPESEEGATE